MPTGSVRVFVLLVAASLAPSQSSAQQSSATKVSFARAVTYPLDPSPYGIASGDFNNDGIPDLAVVTPSNGTINVALGKGNGKFDPWLYTIATYMPSLVAVGKFDGTFQAPASFPVRGATPLQLTVADFNGDGKPDVATANNNSENVSVLLNTTPHPSPPSPRPTHSATDNAEIPNLEPARQLVRFILEPHPLIRIT